MADEPRLTPASPEELHQTLAFALRYDGRKRVHHSDELMARITAERPGVAPRAVWVRGDEEAARSQGMRWPIRLIESGDLDFSQVTRALSGPIPPPDHLLDAAFNE